ncbi:NAD(P)-dependent oxidoreductase [Leptolyngbya valderiana BDU 20041]|nr:NAD(P)-dependent oxidoreductase [Leptolyngbya valderiana BDU 20041]
MRLLLLGPNGQLGSDIRAAAETRGAIELLPLSRERLDLSAPARIPEVLGDTDFDVLVNCTGYHRTDEAEDNAELAFAVNAFAVRSLAEACAARGARFLHVSTDYVFGGLNRATPYTEADGIGPLNVYGASKATGEALALKAHPDTLVLRVASLFGVAGASGKGGNFVETMLRVGREKGHLRVVDDIRMSPTATADIAGRILDLLQAGAPSGLYHAVNAGDASWYEFASAIVERAGVAATVEPCTSADYPTKAVRPPYSALDAGKLAAATAPLPHWRDALERYLRAKGHLG